MLMSTTGWSQITLTSQIASSSDDAEEQGANGSSPGSMDITSTDLELVNDGNDGDQYVGMRFTGINIPQGAYIANAYIQFTVDETDSDSTSVHIKVEDVSSGTAFSSTSFDISSRSVMPDSVLWEDIPAWNTTGASGIDQATPDLSSLVQMIVDQSGWVSGNAINFIMTGIGTRTAESYDGSAGDAPVLIIEYNIPTQVTSQVSSGNDDAEEQGSNGSHETEMHEGHSMKILSLEKRVAFMSGHVEAGLALYRAGKPEQAAGHLLHPVSETHQAERSGIDALGFTPNVFKSVSKALDEGRPASEIEPMLTEAEENI
jgi:hypothetical protein